MILLEYNKVNYKKLLKNVSSKEVDYYLNLLQVENPEFKLLVEHIGGNSINEIIENECQIFQFGSILSLEEMVEHTNMIEPLWIKTFIPMVANGDGEYLLFNNDIGEKNFGKLHLYSPSLLFVNDPISYYDSIFCMILTTIQAYKKGFLKYDVDEDWLDHDMDGLFQIAKNINKDSDYWKL